MAIKVNKKVQENVNELENMTFNTFKGFPAENSRKSNFTI